MNREAVVKELMAIARGLTAYSRYERTIEAILKQIGRADIDPRHVEGYLRLQFGELDGVSRSQFIRETKSIVEAIDADPAGAEGLAKSYRL